jgi:AMMECR1 domain-containing protein
MKLKQWKTVGEVGGKKKNVEYVYKSVEEVLQEGKFRKVSGTRYRVPVGVEGKEEVPVPYVEYVYKSVERVLQEGKFRKIPVP